MSEKLGELAKSPMTATIVLIVAVVLMQFGIIGPAREQEQLVLQQRFFQVEMVLKDINTHIEQINARTVDRWTFSDEKSLYRELRHLNPDIQWVDPETVRRPTTP